MKKLLLSVIFFACFETNLKCQQRTFDIDSVFTKIELPNSYGQIIDITADVDKGLCIIFTNHQCQYAQLYEKRITEISNLYKAQGIKVVAIESKIESFEGSTQSLAEYLESGNLPFQYVIDIDNSLSTKFGAQSSPHAFLMSKKGDEFVLKYSGSIDNNSRKPERASQRYLISAIEALLNNQAIDKPRTKAIGCSIDKG